MCKEGFKSNVLVMGTACPQVPWASRVHSMPQDVSEFGKHRGKHINQVDDGYLEWIVNTFSKSHPRWKAAADALTRRGQMQHQQSAQRTGHVHDLLSDLKSCTRARDLQKGRRVHRNAAETGIDSNMYVATALINMYTKCGSMEDARTVFDSIQEPNVVSWTTLILGYATIGQGLVALNLFSRMKDECKCAPDSVTYVAALKACTSLTAEGGKKGCLAKGREIHSEIGCHMNHFVQNTLIDMYAKGGSMVDARAVFDSIQEPNVVSWNALILGYAENGQGLVALDLFSRMKDERRCSLDPVTYVSVLKACTSLAVDGDDTGKKRCLERGREIHTEIASHMNLIIQNTLMDMYMKCGSMVDARTVFNSIQEPNVVSWNALIRGYADNRQGLVALDLFSRMEDNSSCAPDSVTYVAVLKACASLAADGDINVKKGCLVRGRQIHSKIGCHMNCFVQNTLIDMYAKCSSMVDARTVFDGIQEPDVVSWTALILGYADSGQGLVALELFSRMKDECRCGPDSVAYVAALKACTSLAADGDETVKKRCLEKGREIHLEIGCHMYQFVQNTLIDMYATCGSMEEARTVFDGIQEPDAVSWNALILGYADDGQGLVALELFSRMKDDCRCGPDSVTYVAALKACMSLVADGDETRKTVCLERVSEIHSEIGCHMNRFVQSILIDIYAKCGSMEDAKTVFDCIQEPDVVSWNALILGYTQNGQGLVALDLFSRMKDGCRCAPDSVTYVAAIKACTSLAADGDETGTQGCLERAREIQSEIGCHMNHFVQNTLIDMYVNCGRVEDARTVFDGIQKPDVVSWTALVLGYAGNGQGSVALDLFSCMKNEHRCAPDSVTYVAALKACSSMAADGDETEKKRCLQLGRETHLEIGCHMNHFVQNTLIDMYTKCGSMVYAKAVFDSIKEPDVVSWNVLILGYAESGQGLVALDLFSRMKDDCRCAPDSVTYLAAIKACGSIGAFAIGQRFHSEIREFDAHVVTCLVDFYGRCGSMEEAREVFGLHPRARDISTWTALLAGYGRFGDTGSAFSLFEAMQDQGFQPNAITFVCMLTCCSHAGMVEKAWEYLEVMPKQYGVTPTIMHYNCMIDLLGRANKLDEAIALIQEMPCDSNAVTWTTLLGACRKWKNLEIGRLAFKTLVDLDEKNASAYILMAEIYGSRGMWEEQERLLETRMKCGAWKPPGQAHGERADPSLL